MFTVNGPSASTDASQLSVPQLLQQILVELQTLNIQLALASNISDVDSIRATTFTTQ